MATNPQIPGDDVNIDAPFELKINGNDPYDPLKMFTIFLSWFKINELTHAKGVKGQIFRNALIELKFMNNDPYDILSILQNLSLSLPPSLPLSLFLSHSLSLSVSLSFF